jgi:hypothetical protein
MRRAMKGSADSMEGATTREEFESMPVLPLGLLEKLTGIERRRLRRLLQGGGVSLTRSGNRHMVHRVALRQMMPKFYEGILERFPGAESVDVLDGFDE